jgi:hypothetical protein
MKRLAEYVACAFSTTATSFKWKGLRKHENVRSFPTTSRFEEQHIRSEARYTTYSNAFEVRFEITTAVIMNSTVFWVVRRQPDVSEELSPPSSWSKRKPNKENNTAGINHRRCVPPKRRTVSELHGVTTQKNVIFPKKRNTTKKGSQ